ncbi:MAG TPA: GH116 family glycosyl hydrolase [Candidatus Methylacidiphilales bacterium]|jgi:uncharacterized protein (DUF608 family)|nr:GH116 family glycosyl hydrolase [Candidatus Methylacidiphilales bacterium]
MTTMPYSLPRTYTGRQLTQISYPIGSLGAGMFTLDGTGAFARFSLRHTPDLNIPSVAFSAIAVQDGGAWTARVLEGPVPSWKPFFSWDRSWQTSGHGGGNKAFGFPRFDEAEFSARFPFATVALKDTTVPIEARLRGWSPFVPGDADASSLPVAAVEYTFRNPTERTLKCVYSFHSKNFLAEHFDWKKQSNRATRGGFILQYPPEEKQPSSEGYFAAWIDDPAAKADLAWFRGGWFDAQTMVWKNISEGKVLEQPAHPEGAAGDGGSIYLPLELKPGEEKTVRLLLGWYVPYSTLRIDGKGQEEWGNPDLKTDFYRPWYSSKFAGIDAVIDYWTKENGRLRADTAAFTDAFYDTTLPPEVVDAIAANLAILKSPTVLREHGGKIWAWEGTADERGSCHGTCTHVWNYAQALPHLFPGLERGLREIEFMLSQDERGHQNFRANIPLGPAPHTFHAAADGQLGGILKMYREWRISGDTAWLRGLWPQVRQSLAYCIETWDPDHRGALVEPHHNTYDIEFWGADGMCTSFYLAALRAAAIMGRALGEDVSLYEKLVAAGKAWVEQELFNGEYFIQKIQWKGLRAADPVEGTKVGINMSYSPEAQALLEKEGPKYQYGEGCLSDGILGEWMAWTAGLEPVLDPRKIASHLEAIHRHNFREDLAKHANPQRPSYAFNHEAGLLLCTWPRGGALSLPFVYSEEVWTGIEYQVASHLISFGRVAEGLQIVRACRDRYEGAIRNPFSEIECGHWYARAMASYALLQALSGARYDAVDQVLYLRPQIKGDFRCFLAVQGAYGTVGVRNGQPFFEPRQGKIEIKRIDYLAAS